MDGDFYQLVAHFNLETESFPGQNGYVQYANWNPFLDDKTNYQFDIVFQDQGFFVPEH